MTRDGIEARFMFGPITAFSADDPELRTAIYQAYNDWLSSFARTIRTDCTASRRCPVRTRQPRVPRSSVWPSAGRLARSISSFGASAGIYEEPWEPFWAAAAETGLIVSFHVGGGAGFAPAARPARPEDEKPWTVFNPQGVHQPVPGSVRRTDRQRCVRAASRTQGHAGRGRTGLAAMGRPRDGLPLSASGGQSRVLGNGRAAGSVSVGAPKRSVEAQFLGDLPG